MGDVTNIRLVLLQTTIRHARLKTGRQISVEDFALRGGHLCKHAEGGWNLLQINHMQSGCNAIHVFHPAIQIRRVTCTQS